MKRLFSNGMHKWTLGLSALAALFTGCDNGSDDNGKVTVELKNQISYDEVISDIKSVIYEVEEDGTYSFYLSPSAGLLSIKDMDQAGDALKVQTKNPKGTQTAADNYKIQYQSVTVSSTTLSADVEKSELKANLLTENSLDLYLTVIMKSGHKLIAHYNGACPQAAYVPVELENQYQLDKAISSIGSVVCDYSFSTSLYTWYVYAESGVKVADESKAALVFVTPEKTTYPIVADLAASETVSVKSGNKTAVKGLLSIDKTDDNGKVKEVNFTIEAKDAEGLELRAKYNGAVSFLPADLDNEYQLANDVVAIGSVVYDFNFTTGVSSLYIFKEAGQTKPNAKAAIVLSSTEKIDFPLDVNLAENEAVSVVAGDKAAVKGKLTLGQQTDKFGAVTGVTVELESVDAEDVRIRANYAGELAMNVTSEISNQITTKVDESNKVELKKVFVEKNPGSLHFVFGTNTEATTPEELMAEGHYAAELTIPADAFQDMALTTKNLASTDDCGFIVYDYSKYVIWNNANKSEVLGNDIKSGNVKVGKAGDHYYWELSAELASKESTYAMEISSDWFGTLTEAVIPDMKPVVPVTASYFQITEADQTTVYGNSYKDITSVKVAKVRGKDSGGMANAYEYYAFFLVNEQSDWGEDLNDAIYTPFFRISTDEIGKDFSISDEFKAISDLQARNNTGYVTSAEAEKTCKGTWMVWYESFKSGKYGTPNPSGYAWASICKDGTIHVDFNEETKQASIKVLIQDFNELNSYGYISTNGTKHWFVIEFSGKCEVLDSSYDRYKAFGFGSGSGFERIW